MKINNLVLVAAQQFADHFQELDTEFPHRLYVPRARNDVID
jgi:hypothetical protein